jgi:hypothetical protein
VKLPWIPTFFHNILPVKTENKATSKVGESTICFASSSSSSLAFDLRDLLGGCGWSDTNCWPLGVNPPQHRKGVVDISWSPISDYFGRILHNSIFSGVTKNISTIPWGDVAAICIDVAAISHQSWEAALHAAQTSSQTAWKLTWRRWFPHLRSGSIFS